MEKRKILFVSGTRADYGKQKALITATQNSDEFTAQILVTGMHLIQNYGETWREIDKDFPTVEKILEPNQTQETTMLEAYKNSLRVFEKAQRVLNPDLLILHGDRLETLAGATFGLFRDLKVAHIEGGEVSGTIDETIRHTVTKLSDIHFVSNVEAKERLLQLGEDDKNVFIIGSPEIDAFLSDDLPSWDEVRNHYQIDFDEFALVIFHPVSSEIDKLKLQVRILCDFIKNTKENFIVISPNNDPGREEIVSGFESILGDKRIAYLPSMRFEFYVVALKRARYILGNSSSGVREAPFFGTPTINIGSRQSNRARADSIINVDIHPTQLVHAHTLANQVTRQQARLFGEGESDKKFIDALKLSNIWHRTKQKRFFDID